jgi:hypothetical protein
VALRIIPPIPKVHVVDCLADLDDQVENPTETSKAPTATAKLPIAVIKVAMSPIAFLLRVLFPFFCLSEVDRGRPVGDHIQSGRQLFLSQSGIHTPSSVTWS